jgi:hypothetical protein
MKLLLTLASLTILALAVMWAQTSGAPASDLALTASSAGISKGPDGQTKTLEPPAAPIVRAESPGSLSESSFQEVTAGRALPDELELAPHAPQLMVPLPKYEGFESSWPNDWQLLAIDAKYWGPNECLAYQGSYDGWPAGYDGGGYPSHVDPPACTTPAGYPNDFMSVMVYGPFSTVGATSGSVDFKALVDTELDFDYGGVAAKAGSTDCTDMAGYDGPTVSGDSGGWFDWSEDLSNFTYVGNLLGEANVCILFTFMSDIIVTDLGFFLDNIDINVSGGGCGDDKDCDWLSSDIEESLRQCPDPNNPDTDDDFLLDGVDLFIGTNICVADTDKDGLSDGVEVYIASMTGQPCPHPLDTDTDGDGIRDGADPNRCGPPRY